MTFIPSLGTSCLVTGVWLAAVTIDENSVIPIGSALAVMAGVWIMGSKFQRVIDGQKEIQNRIDNEICRRLDKVESRFDSLPCGKKDCPNE